MVSTPKAPTPPDPVATAAAQTASNKDTAVTQARLNAVNQVTPYGNLTYTTNSGPQYDYASYNKALDAYKSAAPSAQTGSVSDLNGLYDLNGNSLNGGSGSATSRAPMPTLDQFRIASNDVPQYTATQTLSPEQQKLYDLSTQTQAQIGQIGLDQSKRIGDLLGTPVDLSPNAVDAHLTQLGMARLEPQLQRDWQNRESTLMNRGIMPGSEAYAREQEAFNQSKNDAYNQLILGGYGQGQQSILAQRNQPINEITALLSGSQVSQPNFVNSPQTSVQPTNVAGIYNDAYNAQLGAYNSANSQNNAMMGGLFGLGSAALMAPMTGGTSLGGWGFSKLLGR